MTHEELDQRKRELQRKRQKLVNEGRSTTLLDRLISKCQLTMNERRKDKGRCSASA